MSADSPQYEWRLWWAYMTERDCPLCAKCIHVGTFELHGHISVLAIVAALSINQNRTITWSVGDMPGRDELQLHSDSEATWYLTCIRRRKRKQMKVYSVKTFYQSINWTCPPAKSTVGQRSFAFYWPTVWNSLPSALRYSSLSLNTFRLRLQTYLPGQWSTPSGAVVAFLRFWLRYKIMWLFYLLTAELPVQ